MKHSHASINWQKIRAARIYVESPLRIPIPGVPEKDFRTSDDGRPVLWFRWLILNISAAVVQGANGSPRILFWKAPGRKLRLSDFKIKE